MFYGASRNTFNKAHELRRIMTDAEKSLWKELKNRKIFKSRFRRQHPVDIFIVDFYCHEFKLAIEIDGEIHLNQEVAEYDDGRTHDLEKLGIRILRFTNQQVFTDMNTILREILQFVSSSNPL
jgi:very-short-patch-repair endonuclease